MNEIYASWESQRDLRNQLNQVFILVQPYKAGVHILPYTEIAMYLSWSAVSSLPQTHSSEGNWAPGQVLFCFVFFFYTFRKDHVKYLLSSIFLIIIAILCLYNGQVSSPTSIARRSDATSA